MCGFVGVTGVDHAAPIVWLALQTLQHRGQDAAGIGTTEGARIHLHKDLGMVVHAVPAPKLDELVAVLLGGVAHPLQRALREEEAVAELARRAVAALAPLVRHQVVLRSGRGLEVVVEVIPTAIAPLAAHHLDPAVLMLDAVLEHVQLVAAAADFAGGLAHAAKASSPLQVVPASGRA